MHKCTALSTLSISHKKVDSIFLKGGGGEPDPKGEVEWTETGKRGPVTKPYKMVHTRQKEADECALHPCYVLASAGKWTRGSIDGFLLFDHKKMEL